MNGAMTVDEVKAIQRDGIDWNGKLLTVDGDYGPMTQWWHEVISTCCAIEQQVIRTALGYVRAGVKDDGNNRGLIVDGFMLPAGKQFIGSPWCIGVQSAVLRHAGAHWPVHHVSAAGMLKWAAQEKRILSAPRIGCAYAFLYPPDVAARLKMSPGAGHGGIVTGVPKDSGLVMVADGNVGDRCTAGLREAAPLTFVDVVLRPVFPVGVPPKLPKLDGWRDR